MDMWDIIRRCGRRLTDQSTSTYLLSTNGLCCCWSCCCGVASAQASANEPPREPRGGCLYVCCSAAAICTRLGLQQLQLVWKPCRCLCFGMRLQYTYMTPFR